MKSLRVGLVVAVIGASVLAALPAEAATARPGKPCTKQGAIAKAAGGESLICSKKGTRLVWAVQSASGGSASGGSASSGGSSTSAIPSIIENWGFDLGAYDPATKTAGVMALAPIPFPVDSLMQTPITYLRRASLAAAGPTGLRRSAADLLPADQHSCAQHHHRDRLLGQEAQHRVQR